MTRHAAWTWWLVACLAACSESTSGGGGDAAGGGDGAPPADSGPSADGTGGPPDGPPEPGDVSQPSPDGAVLPADANVTPPDGMTPKPDARDPGPDVATPDGRVADAVTPPSDVFVPAPDAADPVLDAFVPTPDAFVAAPDVFVPAPDAFVPTPDVFVPALDAFVPTPDAFVPTPDVFVPPPDVFIPTPDVFVPSPDVFVPPEDAFVPPPDAFVPLDAALPPDGDDDGWPDAEDNCPEAHNPSQADRDRDGPGDACDPCPNDALDRCVLAGPERCNGLDDDQDGEIDEGLAEGGAHFAATSWQVEVDAAIDRGLDYLRRWESGNGYFTGDPNEVFFGALAFLERRADQGTGPALGYVGLDDGDRALVERLLRYQINSDGALQDANNGPYTYGTGGAMMALSAWLTSGGPDEIGAAVSVSTALLNATVAMQRAQGQGASGGWNYGDPGDDLSTTHFAASGLAGAARVVEGADSTLPGVLDMLLVGQSGDGGFQYHPGNGASSSMTVSGIWVARLAGADPSDPLVQGGLGWLQANYTWDSFVGPFGDVSQFYYSWVLTKALATVPPELSPGGLSAADFGALDPADFGYADHPRGAWFDISHALLGWQDPEGAWGTGFNGSQGGWNQVSSHGFALLALERSLGGVHRPEAEPDLAPACNDDADNDGDGHTDDDDPDCRFACGPTERPRAACANGLDDDGNGLLDYPGDPGCLSSADTVEEAPDCANLFDDDADGREDWPADPGCEGRLDEDEADPVPTPACGNGLDDDADGSIDWPRDPQCTTAAQAAERFASACPAGKAAPVIYPETKVIRGDLAPERNQLHGSCGGLRGRDAVYVLVVDRPTLLTISTTNDETDFDTVLYLREGCADNAPELACSDDNSEQDPLSVVRAQVTRPGNYFLVVDARIGSGPYRVDIDRRELAPACGNRLDDDGDGRTDAFDPGCAGPSDPDETDPAAPAACGNGEDDDADERTDFPLDPGCAAQGSPSEADPPAAPACDNGLDDDGDGRPDWPLDPSCAGRGGTSEFAASIGVCNNRRDDEGDGLTDYPDDPECLSAADDRED